MWMLAIDGCKLPNQPITIRENSGVLEVPIEMRFASIKSHLNNIPMNRHTHRNQPKYNHSIYGYMQLVVICD